MEQEPNQERKISDQELADLKTEVVACRTLMASHVGSRSYRHIMGGTGSSFHYYLVDFDKIKTWPLDKQREMYDGIKRSVNEIKKYFQLLEQYPDFREKELDRNGNGFFPNAYPHGESWADLYEKELKKLK